MTLPELRRAAFFTVIVAASAPVAAEAQTTATDPNHAETMLAQATPPAQPAQPGMVGPGMMAHGMMGAMPMMAMRGHMMKVMFAIADADGDGALSFEEVTAIHKRVFSKVDANKDGKVTPEELKSFMQE
jgi:hypothetical protein